VLHVSLSALDRAHRVFASPRIRKQARRDCSVASDTRIALPHWLRQTGFRPVTWQVADRRPPTGCASVNARAWGAGAPWQPLRLNLLCCSGSCYSTSHFYITKGAKPCGFQTGNPGNTSPNAPPGRGRKCPCALRPLARLRSAQLLNLPDLEIPGARRLWRDYPLSAFDNKKPCPPVATLSATRPTHTLPPPDADDGPPSLPDVIRCMRCPRPKRHITGRNSTITPDPRWFSLTRTVPNRDHAPLPWALMAPLVAADRL